MNHLHASPGTAEKLVPEESPVINIALMAMMLPDLVEGSNITNDGH